MYLTKNEIVDLGEEGQLSIVEFRALLTIAAWMDGDREKAIAEADALWTWMEAHRCPICGTPAPSSLDGERAPVWQCTVCEDVMGF